MPGKSLRECVFEATRGLLEGRDWGETTMADIAAAAGVSRQTLYNEFGSRHGVAQAYVLRLVDDFLDDTERLFAAHAHDLRGALSSTFASFLTGARADPMVSAAIAGTARPDIMRLATSEGSRVLEAATVRLANIFVDGWTHLSEPDAQVLSRLLTRLALSFVTLPATTDENPPADVSAVLGPFVESICGDAPDSLAP